jgi:hypothetical protein
MRCLSRLTRKRSCAQCGHAHRAVQFRRSGRHQAASGLLVALAQSVAVYNLLVASSSAIPGGHVHLVGPGDAVRKPTRLTGIGSRYRSGSKLENRTPDPGNPPTCGLYGA